MALIPLRRQGTSPIPRLAPARPAASRAGALPIIAAARRPATWMSALACAAALAAGCQSSPASRDPAASGHSAPVLALSGFQHSTQIRARDSVARAWLSGQLSRLVRASKGLGPAGASSVDRCGSAFNPDGSLIVYCTRSDFGFYTVSGGQAQRRAEVERLLERMGWYDFQQLPGSSTGGLAPELVAGRDADMPAPLTNPQLASLWVTGSGQGEPSTELTRLLLPSSTARLPGLIQYQPASLGSLSRTLARDRHLLMIRVSITYYVAQAQGRFPSPPP
jgi:hypothetical protein